MRREVYSHNGENDYLVASGGLVTQVHPLAGPGLAKRFPLDKVSLKKCAGG